ncbi:MAG: PA2779 family protein [Deltaproteobacteria bacterium]|nr:PA2779 family protein [Deltaproteobacteria bacterium]
MRLFKRLYFRQIALVVAFSMFVIGAIPAKSMAYVAGPEAVAASGRAVDMAKVQRVLESRLVADKLEATGLPSAEIMPRIERLTDDELHQFASQLDGLYPGGDGLGVVIALLVIVILVMVIMKLSNRKIIIR